jgi:hypothetical protein
MKRLFTALTIFVFSAFLVTQVYAQTMPRGGPASDSAKKKVFSEKEKKAKKPAGSKKEEK